jgi:pimeloyl-ACP methyl ester carboxylesterase
VGPPARRLDAHVEDAAALIEALDAAPATIVGSSTGGVLALRLAVARSDLVSALVLIEPAYQLALVPSISASLAIGRVMLRWTLRRDAEGAALRFYRWATGYPDGRNQYDAYPERWQKTALGHARAALRELLQAAVPGPPRSALMRIAKPTAVVIGDAGVAVFRRCARRALEAIPGAYEIPAPGAAHLVYTDQPSVCAAAIVDVAIGTRRAGELDNAETHREPRQRPDES